MTEYRVVITFKDKGIRRKIINRNTRKDAIETANGADLSIAEKKLSPYWLGAKVVIETREVGKWTVLD